MHREGRRSWAWLLLPTAFVVVGGIVAYLLLRNDDPERARDCLYLGVATTAIGLALNVAGQILLGSVAPGLGVNL